MQVFQSTLLFLTHASDGYSTALWRINTKVQILPTPCTTFRRCCNSWPRLLHTPLAPHPFLSHLPPPFRSHQQQHP